MLADKLFLVLKGCVSLVECKEPKKLIIGLSPIIQLAIKLQETIS